MLNPLNYSAIGFTAAKGCISKEYYLLILVDYKGNPFGQMGFWKIKAQISCFFE